LTRIDSVVEVQPKYHAENASRDHTMREGVDYSHVVTRWADLILPLPDRPVHSRTWFHPLQKTEASILVAMREPREHQSRATTNKGAM